VSLKATPRMQQIQALLADEPNDPFLRYGLAMEFASMGDDETAAAQLVTLCNESPYVPAFLMAGQILNRLGRVEEACEVLRRGLVAARKEGNSHAEGEMAGLLTSIE
jgi:thioredoxin-like negative regulator of GroEL